MALDLNDLRYFVHVVDRKGFTAAGRALALPKSTLSRRISALEDRLGARLLQRSSRRFVVTDLGEEVYQHAQAMMIEADAAETAVKRRLAEPRGKLRLTTSIGLAAFALADLLPRFMARYPDVEVRLHATNRFVDLIDEGFDVGLRAHSAALPDSGLVQRTVARLRWGLVAAPAYLASAGTPRTPHELEGHAGLALSSRNAEPAWELRDARGAVAHARFKPRLQSDDMVTLKHAAAAGLGLLALPVYVVKPELAAGTLVRVLPEWVAGEGTLSLVMPSRRGQLPAVRALVEFLAIELPGVVRE